MLPVMEELRALLREVREDTGASFAQVAAHLERSENAVRRFERGETAPAFADVDQWVAAYAEATGHDAVELWSRAIAQAEVRAQGEDRTAGDRIVERARRRVALEEDEEAGRGGGSAGARRG